MRVFGSLKEVADYVAGGAVAIGNFDGVHLGHQQLIKQTCQIEANKPCGVLTFSPHPLQLLQPQISHFYLTCDHQKTRLFAKLAIDALIILPIDEQFLLLSPQAFVKDILVDCLKVKNVVVGDDFTFGRLAAGDARLLAQLGQHYGYETHVLKPVMLNGYRCSSTNIRNFLKAGEIRQANNMLGHPFSLYGQVISGQRKATGLGFSTANIIPKSFFGLKFGVYATVTRVFADHGHNDYLSATNVGIRPTISQEQKLVVETHCLDISDLDLSNKMIEIFFIDRIRDEQKFSSIPALQEQVQKDCQQIRQSRLLNPALFHVED